MLTRLNNLEIILELKSLSLLFRKKRNDPFSVSVSCSRCGVWRQSGPIGQGTGGKVLLARREMPASYLVAYTRHRSLPPSSEALEHSPGHVSIVPQAPLACSCVLHFMDSMTSAAPVSTSVPASTQVDGDTELVSFL